MKCVGQQIQLAVEGPIPADAEIKWRIPNLYSGSYFGAIKSYTLRSPTEWCERAAVEPLEEEMVRGPLLDFYWIDAVSGDVTVEVTAPDGSFSTASAAFKVQRPTCSGFQLEPAGVGSVISGVDADGYVFLRYGVARHSPGKRGMFFETTVAALADFGGHFGLVQTINTTRGFRVGAEGLNPGGCRGMSEGNWGGGYILDRVSRTIPFFNDKIVFVPAGGGIDLTGSDSPSIARADASKLLRIYAHDRFEGYLVFKPQQQNDGEDNIFVTLRQYEWSWKGNVERPDGAAVWPTVPDREVPVPTERDSTYLPMWIGRVQDYQDPMNWPRVAPCPVMFGGP